MYPISVLGGAESLSSRPNSGPPRPPPCTEGYRRVSGSRALLGHVLAAQLVARPVQADLDRPLGDPQPDGDRRLGQVLAVAQRQQLAVAAAEAQQGGLDLGPLDR